MKTSLYNSKIDEIMIFSRQHFLMVILMMITLNGFSQSDKKFVRQGNKHYEKKEFENSEISYRKALEEESGSFNALFNLGDALYKQEKFEDAAKEFNTVSQTGNDRRSRASSFHNLGNALLKANRIEESIQAYKNSLRNNPNDLETKYNLAYAQDLLKQQQQQQQNKEQNKNENQEEKEDQSKDQQQDKEQQQNKEDQQEQQQKEQPENQKEQEQQKPRISKEDAERLLEAMALDEKELQEKLKKAKARQKRVVTKKNW